MLFERQDCGTEIYLRKRKDGRFESEDFLLVGTFFVYDSRAREKYCPN
jgi:hypothetical protein